MGSGESRQRPACQESLCRGTLERDPCSELFAVTRKAPQIRSLWLLEAVLAGRV